MTAQWIKEARELDVVQVAEHLGIEVSKSGSTFNAGPCPVCGAQTRHTKRKDKRGALGITHDQGGWICFQCEARGDSIDLVALTTIGKRLRDALDHEMELVRQWYLER